LQCFFFFSTRPLVSQQVEACHQITGIPQIDTAEIQGHIQPPKRKELWKTRRVFFCTPQTFDNDISSGNVDPRHFVCIVIDEAHKAQGNYAYVTSLQNVAAVSRNFRLLALSATPGKDIKKVQDVITNLFINHIEIKLEDDIDVRPYTHTKLIETEKIALVGPLKELEKMWIEMMAPICNSLCNLGLLSDRRCDKLNAFVVMTSLKKFTTGPLPSNILPNEKGVSN
jgi:Fanconi anemia group M protein